MSLADQPVVDVSYGPKLVEQVLEPMKRRFVGKDEVIDLLGVCLAGGENLFILGPPGTAKSALVQDLSRRLWRSRLRLSADTLHRAERALWPFRYP